MKNGNDSSSIPFPKQCGNKFDKIPEVNGRKDLELQSVIPDALKTLSDAKSIKNSIKRQFKATQFTQKQIHSKKVDQKEKHSSNERDSMKAAGGNVNHRKKDLKKTLDPFKSVSVQNFISKDYKEILSKFPDLKLFKYGNKKIVY